MIAALFVSHKMDLYLQFSFKNISSQQIQTIRQQMLKFAVLQLRDEDLAEDVVQEALTKAYQHADSFRGAAALKNLVFCYFKESDY